MDLSNSMQYTIGTALDRARDLFHSVDVLVDGQWVTGEVVVCDGVGVVLDNAGQEHSVVRLERISAVRVAAAPPMRRRFPETGDADSDWTFEPVAMPAPRAASG